MSDLDPRSDEAYRSAREMANLLARSFRRHRVRNWLRLTRIRVEMWLGIR